jgi:hypothetical protein
LLSSLPHGTKGDSDSILYLLYYTPRGRSCYSNHWPENTHEYYSGFEPENCASCSPSYDKISGESFLEFLQKLQLAYPDSPKIHLIVDRGSCHTSKVVKEFLAGENVRINPPLSAAIQPKSESD